MAANRVWRGVAPLLLPILIIALWFVATRGAPSMFFPKPELVFERFVANWLFALVPVHVVPSLVRLGLGVLVAVIGGIAIGMLLGMKPGLFRIARPYLAFGRSLPGSAIVVIFLVSLGSSDFSRVMMIAYVAIFPVIMNTVDGVRGIDSVLLDAMRSYRFGRFQRTWHIYMKGSSPQVSVGIRTAISFAFMIMIVSEYFGGTNGIGYFTRESAGSFFMADMWSGMILLGILGILINAIVAYLQKHLLAWYFASRASSK